MSQSYTTTYTFDGQPISCELTNGDENSNWTTVTLSAENNQPDFMERVRSIAENWADWAETQSCRSEVTLKNNQVAVSLDGSATRIQDWLGNLEERFSHAGSRMTLTAGAGGSNGGPNGGDGSHTTTAGTSGLGGGSSGWSNRGNTITRT